MIFDGGEFQVFPWKFSQRACKPEKQHGVWWRPAELKFAVSSQGWRRQKMWLRLSKTLWSYCFYRCLTWNLYIWVMSFNLVGVCLRNRKVQAKQARYKTTNSLNALLIYSEAAETDEERCQHTKMLWLGCIHLCHQLVTRWVNHNHHTQDHILNGTVARGDDA